MPGNMFESRGPLMESRVVRQPPIKRTISDPITLVPIVENLNNMPPPPMGGPSGFGAQPQPFGNSPPPSQMFNPQPAGTFGGPPSGIGAFPPPSMGVIEQTSNIYQAPTFSAPPPPPQMIYNLPPEGATRPPAFMPPPLANPTHEAPVPMPPPGFFESLMGSTPGSQPLVQSNIGASGVRQTEIDIVQNRDAAGSHRTVTITLPNQPAPNNPSEVIINLDNPQPSSTIYGSSSNIRASGFRPPAIALPPGITVVIQQRRAAICTSLFHSRTLAAVTYFQTIIPLQGTSYHSTVMAHWLQAVRFVMTSDYRTRMFCVIIPMNDLKSRQKSREKINVLGFGPSENQQPNRQPFTFDQPKDSTLTRPPALTGLGAFETDRESHRSKRSTS